jgi:hypothetical protein
MDARCIIDVLAAELHEKVPGLNASVVTGDPMIKSLTVRNWPKRRRQRDGFCIFVYIDNTNIVISLLPPDDSMAHDNHLCGSIVIVAKYDLSNPNCIDYLINTISLFTNARVPAQIARERTKRGWNAYQVVTTNWAQAQ